MENIYENDFIWMSRNARHWREERRSVRRLALADRALTVATMFLVIMCVVAYFSASYVIAEHERDFCFAIAECPKA